MDFQIIKVEVDGIEKGAKVLKIVYIDGKEYAIYAIDNGNETSDIYSSEVIKDEEGYDKLVDITDLEARKNVGELINTLFS